MQNICQESDSKVHDIAFFDGESEDYAEHMTKLRQYGGT